MSELYTFLIIGILFLIIGVYLGVRLGYMRSNREWNKRLPLIRQESAKRSRAVLEGQFSEQLSPFLPDFPYNPNEVRFIGKPIDLLVFKGMDNREIEEIVFVEVKTGKSQLSNIERKVRDAIKEGKVSWDEYKVALK